MKASSSRQRSETQNTISKYSKPPTAKPITPLQNTNINVAVVSKKTELKKSMPPKLPAKAEYNVEVNMTESKIFQAKKGLLLLKRKMNRTGMSRQKNYSHTDKAQENLPHFNRANSNQELKSQKVTFQKKEALVKNQKYKQATQKIPNKQMPTKITQIRKPQPEKPVISEYQDERPIAQNNNFMDLLERQMKKEGSINKAKKGDQIKVPQNKNKIFDDNGAEIILQYCSKGCGRMFNPQTLQKHQKVCEKVFQSKRKAFNSASHRLPDAEGYHPPSSSNNKFDNKPQKKKNEIPKWKMESAAFRAGIKLGKNKPLTKQEQAMVQMTQENRVCCQFCGRKFSEEAAKKHVPFCQRKSKQIGKNNIKMKR